MTRNGQCPFLSCVLPLSWSPPPEGGCGEKETTDVWFIQTQHLSGNLFGLVRESVQLIIDMAKKENWAGMTELVIERQCLVSSPSTQGHSFVQGAVFGKERKLWLFNRYSVSAPS